MRKPWRRRRVGHGGPGPGSHTPPLQTQELWEGEQQQERGAEQDGIGRDRERRVPLQQGHRENRVGTHAEGGDRTRRSPTKLAFPVLSPSNTTRATPTMEIPTPRTPFQVGRSRPRLAPRSNPHTGAVAKIRPVLPALERLTPNVKPVWAVATPKQPKAAIGSKSLRESLLFGSRMRITSNNNRPPTVNRRATSIRGEIVAAAYFVDCEVQSPESGSEDQRDFRRNRGPVLRFRHRSGLYRVSKNSGPGRIRTCATTAPVRPPEHLGHRAWALPSPTPPRPYRTLRRDSPSLGISSSRPLEGVAEALRSQSRGSERVSELYSLLALNIVKEPKSLPSFPRGAITL